MIDHVGFGVSNYEGSKAVYEHALRPLGLEVLMEPMPQVCGFGSPSEQKHGAFVLDSDGNNAEAVCHQSQA